MKLKVGDVIQWMNVEHIDLHVVCEVLNDGRFVLATNDKNMPPTLIFFNTYMVVVNET